MMERYATTLSQDPLWDVFEATLDASDTIEAIRETMPDFHVVSTIEEAITCYQFLFGDLLDCRPVVEKILAFGVQKSVENMQRGHIVFYSRASLVRSAADVIHVALAVDNRNVLSKFGPLPCVFQHPYSIAYSSYGRNVLVFHKPDDILLNEDYHT